MEKLLYIAFVLLYFTWPFLVVLLFLWIYKTTLGKDAQCKDWIVGWLFVEGVKKILNGSTGSRQFKRRF